MKLTLAVDPATLERARQVARQRGTSLNALIRDFIEHLAGQSSGDQVLADFEALWAEPGRSDGRYKFDRELYSERMSRYKPR